MRRFNRFLFRHVDPRVLLLSLATLALAACATTPPQIHFQKQALREYEASGQYLREITSVMAQARADLARRVAAKTPTEKLAIVFDIDETVLSNYPALLANDFGWITAGPCDAKEGKLPTPCGLGAFIGAAKSTAIAPARTLVAEAQQAGLAVFFITGRPEPLRAASEKNLKAEGMGTWAGLILKPVAADAPKYPTLAAYKTAERRKITAQGYVIVANVGDQQSDLEGGYAEATYKLPNPFYFNP